MPNIGDLKNGIEDVIVEKFRGRIIDDAFISEVKRYIMGLLSSMLAGIDDNPPLVLDVIRGGQPSRGLLICAGNFYTFLALRGIAINHRDLGDQKYYRSGKFLFAEHAPLRFGVTVSADDIEETAAEIRTR